MWLDVLALLLLGIFAGMGAMRGGLASGLGLLSLGVAYAAAIFGASHFGSTAAGLLGVPPWVGLPVAGTLAFAVAYLLMALLSWSLRRLERRRRRRHWRAPSWIGRRSRPWRCSFPERR